MYKWLMIILYLLPAFVWADEATEILKRADAYRQTSDELKVRSEIKLFKDGKLDKERLYDVFIKPERKSLVISRSPSEEGQRVLMLDDRFWLVLPKSKRPIRITPMQKLLGEASTGDVATMRWAEDYSAQLMDNEEGSEHRKLSLTASRTGVTYAKIILTVSRVDDRPLHAELYLSSGKLAKEASFEYPEQGDVRVSKMVLRDKINTRQHTEIRYLEREEQSVSGRYFNPAYLAKNPRLAL